MDPNELIQAVKSYTDDPEAESVLTKALAIASNAHDGFQRINGDPFLTHPLAVASTLAEWHAPYSVIAVGLLHDILSADYSRERNFDHVLSWLRPEICELLETVIRLNSFFRHAEGGDFQSDSEIKDFWHYIASLLKKEPDAVVIKIADRMHNLQTASALTRYFQERFARIALNLLVPLTDRLCMGIAKRKLEDYSFQINYPQYSTILKRHDTDIVIRQEVENVKDDLRQILGMSMPQSKVRWQTSSLYKIGQDIKLGKLNQEDPPPPGIADIGSFIILTDDENDCYQTLRIIHKLYQPVKGQFGDFIGDPKENGYRSLHTLVKHPSGNYISIIIRTFTMDLVSEYGIMARWWNVPEDLLPPLPEEPEPPNGEIKVFTPAGEIKYFPQGATILDFAYNIHSDIGHRYVSALVNGEHVELHRQLQNGDTIEIIADDSSTGPVLDWLGYVRTPQAANRIRQWLVQNQRNNMAERGQVLLNLEMQFIGWDPAEVQLRRFLKRLAARENMKNTGDLLVSIGVGRHKASEVVESLKSMQLKSMRSTDYVEPTIDVLVAAPEEAQLLRVFARCCRPIPSDDIVGYRRSDGVLAIHKRTCSLIKEPEKVIPVKWSTKKTELNYVIVVEAPNRPGLARDITTVITALGIDMQGFTAQTRPDGITASAYIHLGKTTSTQRERLLKALEGLPYLFSVELIHSSFLSTSSQKLELPKVAQISNPYGPGLAEGSRFYGREIECRRISTLLRDQAKGTAILLWGQKRIGKTSLVLRLKEQSQGDFLPIYLDMQGLKDVSTTQFLHRLMTKFSEALQDNIRDTTQEITTPALHRLRKDPLGHFDTFMAQIQEAIHHRALVVILDEFQCLCSLREGEVTLDSIFSRLRSLALHWKGLHFILSGGGLLSQLTDQCGILSLFNITYDEKLSYLGSNAAYRLIRDGLTRVGRITELATDLLLDFTAGHPFYLQLLCSRLYEYAQENKTMITQHVVSQRVQEWLQDADKSRFQHLWEGYDATSAQRNKLILSAIAQLSTSSSGVEYDHLAEVLCSTMSEQDLLLSLEDLANLGVLRRDHLFFAIEVKLFAQWLRLHWPLKLALKGAQ